MSHSLIQSFKITKKYKGRSKFPFWGKVRVGDIVDIQIDLEYPGSGYCGKNMTKPVQPIISNRCVNRDDPAHSFSCNFGSFVDYLGKLEMELYEDPCECEMGEDY